MCRIFSGLVGFWISWSCSAISQYQGIAASLCARLARERREHGRDLRDLPGVSSAKAHERRHFDVTTTVPFEGIRTKVPGVH